jgi:hypothetical protein
VEKISALFKTPDAEWSHMTEAKRLLFLRNLRRDAIDNHGLNGNSWVSWDWQQYALEEELGFLPDELQESMRISFSKFGFLQPFY